MTESIGGIAFAEMVFSASAALKNNKEPINRLNVFPVPDGDTGTNMSLTMATAADALRKKKPETLTEAADATANALLRGARGNSGVILSLLFRGLAKSLKGKERCTASQLAKAMSNGVETAYGAVMKPAEGTILTVSRMAAEKAVHAARHSDDIEHVIEEALKAAEISLAETTELNPVLKKAGVVDAGCKGFIVIWEAFLSSLRGITIQAVSDDNESEDEDSAFEVFDTENITFAFDTVYIVRKEKEDIDLAPLREYLNSIGDSLVIGESDESFKVHVHTNTPGDALNESQKYGILELAKIENMRTQHEDILAGRKAQSTDDLKQVEKELESEEEDVIAPAEKETGFVTVCAGDGLAKLFKDMGADRVVTGGQTMNPSTEDILKEINRTPAETVFVFPNNKNIIMAAEQCIPLTEKKVVVIPTKTVPQGISALAFRTPDLSVEEMVEEFRETASRVHTAQITYAARDSDFDGHDIHAGEYLALLDSALIGSSNDFNALLGELTKAMEEYDPEFLTVYYGSDVKEEDANHVADILTESFDMAEISVINGGQPVYYYMISAE